MPLLRVEAEVALLPLPAVQHAEFLEQLAHQRGTSAGDGHVVRGPGVGGHVVLAPAGVAAGALLHLKDDEVVKPALVEPPRRREPRDAASDDDEGHPHGARGGGERLSVPQPVTDDVGAISEATGDGPAGLAAETDQRGAHAEETSARYTHRLMSAHS